MSIRPQHFALVLGVLAVSTHATAETSRTSRTLTWVVPPSSVMPRRPAEQKNTVPCVSVRVTTAGDAKRVTGDPVPGIDVKLGRNPGGQLVTSTSNNDGVAEFCGVAFDVGGAYSFTASADGASALTSAPFVVPNRTIKLEWSVQPAASISGRALAGEKGLCPTVTATELGAANKPGSPIGGIVVKGGKNPPGGAHLEVEGTTDANGQVQFCDLKLETAGAYALVATVKDAPAAKDNPLYQGDGGVVSNPLYVGKYSQSVEWTVQPQPVAVGTTWSEGCPTVKVYANTGFIDDGVGLTEQRGGAVAQVSVVIDQLPKGNSLKLTTDEKGEASLCGFVPKGQGAFNLRASVEHGRPSVSDPFAVR